MWSVVVSSFLAPLYFNRKPIWFSRFLAVATNDNNENNSINKATLCVNGDFDLNGSPSTSYVNLHERKERRSSLFPDFVISTWSSFPKQRWVRPLLPLPSGVPASLSYANEIEIESGNGSGSGSGIERIFNPVMMLDPDLSMSSFMYSIRLWQVQNLDGDVWIK